MPSCEPIYDGWTVKNLGVSGGSVGYQLGFPVQFVNTQLSKITHTKYDYEKLAKKVLKKISTN